MMIEVHQKILDFFSYSPDIIFGISKNETSGIGSKYQSVLSVAIPHSRRVAIDDYREAEFEALIVEARQRSIDVISEIASILIDQALPAGQPNYESQCPPECMLCIEACPYHALTDTLWSNSAKRSELIDFQLCNRMRSAYISSHGRKHACGVCMAACPVGR